MVPHPICRLASCVSTTASSLPASTSHTGWSCTTETCLPKPSPATQPWASPKPPARCGHCCTWTTRNHSAGQSARTCSTWLWLRRRRHTWRPACTSRSSWTAKVWVLDNVGYTHSIKPAASVFLRLCDVCVLGTSKHCPAGERWVPVLCGEQTSRRLRVYQWPGSNNGEVPVATRRGKRCRCYSTFQVLILRFNNCTCYTSLKSPCNKIIYVATEAMEHSLNCGLGRY